jgi:hypothetical protein
LNFRRHENLKSQKAVFPLPFYEFVKECKTTRMSIIIIIEFRFLDYLSFIMQAFLSAKIYIL